MPLNVRRYYTSVLLVLFCFMIAGHAQTVPAPSPAIAAPAPTSGDIMRERISKAKAFIVVRNYNAAIYELENIRKESGDPTVQGVVNVLLMNSYLEQGDYKRAQDLLNEFYKIQKTTKPNAVASYIAVAGQVVKGARNRAERYRALGLSVSDRTLPLEALNDLEKMRETVEIVITQSKEIGADKAKSADGMAMLEEASNSRGMIARDDYDARHWKDEVADTREKMASSRSVVLSAVENTPTDAPTNNLTAAANKAAEIASAQPPVITPNTGDQAPVYQPVAAPTREREVKPVEKQPSETVVANNDKPVYVPSAPPTQKPEPKAEESKQLIEDITTPVNDGSPLNVGSLVAYATKQAPAVYPQVARTMRASGVVKVEVTVDEKGDVSDVQTASGPSLLQGAAKDAIKKWKFTPFVRNGQPVKATGFVSFNFSL
ncbi:hypothetical protein BH10ACI2_BH10ACI2_08840 [soil metagenome]